MKPSTPTSGVPVVQVRITGGPLKSGIILNHGGLESPRGGGVCTFEGLTRPEHHPEHGELVCLRYEAAEPLATRRMKILATEIARHHELHHIQIEHAIGEVAVGEASVRIITIADHREAAFTACRESIDRLKSEIPIWKQECWRTGATWSEATSVLPQANSQEPIR